MYSKCSQDYLKKLSFMRIYDIFYMLRGTFYCNFHLISTNSLSKNINMNMICRPLLVPFFLKRLPNVVYAKKDNDKFFLRMKYVM